MSSDIYEGDQILWRNDDMRKIFVGTFIEPEDDGWLAVQVTDDWSGESDLDLYMAKDKEIVKVPLHVEPSEYGSTDRDKAKLFKALKQGRELPPSAMYKASRLYKRKPRVKPAQKSRGSELLARVQALKRGR